MTEKFIYAFDKETKDRLISQGYHLLNENEVTNTYIFANNMNLQFSVDNKNIVFSNTLAF